MNASELVERYAAIWNEPDETRRREAVAGLFRDDGAHFTNTTESIGHDAIAARITRAFERFVKDAGFRFKALESVDGHHGSVKFYWAMVPAQGGMAQMVGSDFLMLDEEGRIRTDYQFVEP